MTRVAVLAGCALLLVVVIVLAVHYYRASAEAGAYDDDRADLGSIDATRSYLDRLGCSAGFHRPGLDPEHCSICGRRIE